MFTKLKHFYRQKRQQCFVGLLIVIKVQGNDMFRYTNIWINSYNLNVEQDSCVTESVYEFNTDDDVFKIC